jgi:hypothetical protein
VKSDSPTVENWLFKYDSARNKEQIWIDAVVVQIADGKVSNVRHAPHPPGNPRNVGKCGVEGQVIPTSIAGSQCATASPAIALGLQSTRPVGQPGLGSNN